MELEGVKQDLQGAVSDVGPGVKRQLRQASQQWEPEVHVLVLVTELQTLQTTDPGALQTSNLCMQAAAQAPPALIGVC